MIFLYQTRVEIILCIPLIVLTLAVASQCFYFMGTTSLWNDELYSIMKFSSKGWLISLTDYHVPNNHIFFNFLNSITPLSDSVAPIRARFWSFISVILSFTILAEFFYRKGLLVIGAISLFILYGNQEQLFLALQARGYGVIVLCTIMLLVACERYIDKQNLGSLIFLALSAFIGVWTVPTFVFFAGTLMLMIFLFTRDARVFIAGILVVIAISLAYMPVYKQIFQNAKEYAGVWGKDYASIKSVAKTIRIYATSSFNDGMIFLLLSISLLSPYILAFCIWRAKKRMALFLISISLSVIVFFIACLYLETPAIRTTSFIVFPIVFLLALSTEYILRRCFKQTVRNFIYSFMVLPLVYFSPATAFNIQYTPIENWMETADIIERAFPKSMDAYVNYREHYLQIHFDNKKIIDKFDEQKFINGSLIHVDTDFRKTSSRFDSAKYSSIAADVHLLQKRGKFQRISFLPNIELSYIDRVDVNGRSVAASSLFDGLSSTGWSPSELLDHTTLLSIELEPNNRYLSLVLSLSSGEIQTDISVYKVVGKKRLKVSPDNIVLGKQSVLILLDGYVNGVQVETKINSKTFTISEIWAYKG